MSNSDHPPHSPTKTDLSLFTQTITRQLHTVASFLAPPPSQPYSPPSTQLHNVSPNVSSSSIEGLKNDLAEIGYGFKTGASVSSSSSGHDVDDLPRLSLDSDKPTKLNMNTNNRQRTRLAKPRTTQLTDTRVGRPTRRRSTDTTLTANRCLSVDSPRINSSGKIVFHGLERSSSSPSSLIGGSRVKHRGMERSYSGNVRITPVLNVPVFGLQMFNSQQRREGCSSGNNGGSNRGQRFNGKLRGECC